MLKSYDSIIRNIRLLRLISMSCLSAGMLFGSPLVWGYLPVAHPGDLNGDGRDDLVLYSADHRTWTAITVSGEVLFQDKTFGSSESIPLVGRFIDGRISTLAFYQPDTGMFSILRDWSNDETMALSLQAVWPHGVPVVGDFNGDGIDEVGCYYPDRGLWWAWTIEGKVVVRDLSWGFKGTLPVVGDFDGDGTDDISVYNRKSGNWYLRSIRYSFPPRTLNWGQAKGSPLTCDLDGDGHDDIISYSGDGYWFVTKALSNSSIALNRLFGDDYTVPVPARYESSSMANYAYYTLAMGMWNVLQRDGQKVTPNLNLIGSNANY